jgi:hypothetical protein
MYLKKIFNYVFISSLVPIILHITVLLIAAVFNTYAVFLIANLGNMMISRRI